ncbi:MAG TPA: HNH endonuclease signature motif containing protein [Mycobacteriales bacterium]|nr:HNH endonuclease signature motif containing protein [Mycobacteriales bacterium]
MLHPATQRLAEDMTPGGEIDFRTPEQTRADALADLAKLALNSRQLPDTAGEPTQICLIAQVEDLTRQLSPGDTPTTTLDGDTTITPNTLRMLACDAAIIPVVMRGQSEILDLARSTRTWNRAQRRAAKIRAHGHCEAPLCQARIQRCALHHEHPWTTGGPTNLDNGTSP